MPTQASQQFFILIRKKETLLMDSVALDHKPHLGNDKYGKHMGLRINLQLCKIYMKTRDETVFVFSIHLCYILQKSPSICPYNIYDSHGETE